MSAALCRKPAAQAANLDKVQAEQSQEAARTREEVPRRAEGHGVVQCSPTGLKIDVSTFGTL